MSRFDEPFELDEPSSGPIGGLRSLGATMFGGVIRARRALYDLGVKKRTKVERPVISVGNLTVGGTGKTPFTIYLCDRLEKRGLRVAVLSRGYGKKVRHQAPLLVGEEGRLFVDAEEGGDEPVLIAMKTKAAVVVSPDRALGARFAIDRVGADVLIMDDGFQHWRLHRDLDILMLDEASPFGNGRLLPAGSLREDPEAAARADLVVVNRVNAYRAGAPLAGLAGAAPQLQISILPATIGPLLGGFRQPAATIEGKRVALFAAIAKPERFERTVRALGPSEVVDKRFLRDHAWIEPEALDAYCEAVKAVGVDYILTTEKDAARLIHVESAASLWTLSVQPLLLSGEADLDRALDRVLAKGEDA